MHTIEKQWLKIKELLSKDVNWDDMFNAGASAEDIQRLETALSIKLPEALKVLYSLQNGQLSHFPPLCLGHYLLSIDEIIDTWEYLKEFVPQSNQESRDLIIEEYGEFDSRDLMYHPKEMQQVDWHPKWIPFFKSKDNVSYLLMDLAPSKFGKTGQVFIMFYGGTEIVGNSFSQFMNKWMKEIESRE